VILTHEWMVVILGTLGAVHLAALVFAIWAVRDVGRMTRAVAGLVYQEEEKTRTLLQELCAPRSR
jgi:hypothetical protein